ncbi:MAG: amidase, partial [Actinomycetota bacterium]
MELVGRTAIDLAAAVRAGHATATEVVQAHLDHLAAVEHRLGAFVATREGAALEHAAAIDADDDRRDLPLAGVPIAIKDVIDVAGLPTRHGSRATSAEPAIADDPLVSRLQQAGAVVVGKTRCPELSLWGTSDDPDGTAVSPWDPTRTAGGSSGGSAAAVGAGVVPLAVASDGLGSSRIPAAACGVVGMRPGEGWLLDELGGEPHWFGLSRFGTIATTVADTALLLDAMAGEHQLRQLKSLGGPHRVAVSWRPPAPGVVVSGAWREAAIEAGRLLHHAGHTVEHRDPPYDRSLTQSTISRWTQGAGADVRSLDLERDELQPRTRAHVAAGERLARVSPVDAADAARWREKVRPFFEDYDLLVTPTFARTQPAATQWHARPWAANLATTLSAYPYCYPWNLADLPAIVVPLWEDAGRPLSVQIVAGPGREALALSVAARLEALVAWARHAPGWGVPI